MADPQPIGAKSPLFNVATLSGRVEAYRNHEGKFYTAMTLPAPDTFSRPQQVEVRSGRKLGNKGDELEIGVRIGGYTRRGNPTKDGEAVTFFQMSLEAIEG